MSTANLYERVFVCLSKVRADGRFDQSELVASLAMAANELSLPTPPPSRVVDLLRVAQREALAGGLPSDVCEMLSCAFDEALLVARPEMPEPSCRDVAVDARFLAAWGVPRLRSMQRSPLQRPSVPEAEPEPPTEAEPPEPLAIAVDQDTTLRASSPTVRLEPELGMPVPRSEALRRIAHHCCDTVALLARHRTERRAHERAYEEQRILECADAFVSAGPGAVDALFEWWLEARESPNPWKQWAPFFLLSILAGDDVMPRLSRELDALPCTPTHVGVVADALVSSPHPALLNLARLLLEDPRPQGRAIGLDLLTRLAGADEELVWSHLHDANPVVLATAIRAVPRMPQVSSRIVDLLLRYLDIPDRHVAWQLARTLLLSGRPEPYYAIRNGGPLRAHLGPRALEVLVLAGGLRDVAELEPFLRRAPPSGGDLKTLARLGHPGVYAYLLHFLADGETAPVAADALALLFGSLVPSTELLDPNAWRAAIGRASFEPEQRLRRGRPWSPEVVVWECSPQFKLSRLDIEARLDELAVRAGARTQLDLGRFLPMVSPALDSFLASAQRITYSPGSWDARLLA